MVEPTAGRTRVNRYHRRGDAPYAPRSEPPRPVRPPGPPPTSRRRSGRSRSPAVPGRTACSTACRRSRQDVGRPPRAASRPAVGIDATIPRRGRDGRRAWISIARTACSTLTPRRRTMAAATRPAAHSSTKSTPDGAISRLPPGIRPTMSRSRSENHTSRTRWAQTSNGCGPRSATPIERGVRSGRMWSDRRQARRRIGSSIIDFRVAR